MICGFDSTFLLYLLAPPDQVGVPFDGSDQPISFAKERVAGLVAEMEKVAATIIVGTPALSEIMVRSGVQAGQAYMATMRKSKAFKIVPFDEKSAVEVALMAGHTVLGEPLSVDPQQTKAKLKYDRQIVAIAHTEGATTFYTDDKGQRLLAQRLGMTVKGLADCIVPTDAAQGSLPLSGAHHEKPE